MRNANEIKREVWEKEYEDAVVGLAQTMISVTLFSGLDPEKKIGERESGRIGNTRGIVSVTAKEALEKAEQTRESQENLCAALLKLLGELPEEPPGEEPPGTERKD